MRVGYPETGAFGEGSSPCVGGVSVANLGVACDIWGDGKWREADELQHDMGKRILGVSKRTSNAVVRGELGWHASVFGER